MKVTRKCRKSKAKPPSSIARIEKVCVKSAAIGPDGIKRWYDQEGNEVSAPKSNQDGIGIPYDDDVAQSFASLVASGKKFGACLGAVGLSHPQYLVWRKKNPSFGAAVDAAREMRSELVHDATYDHDIVDLMEKPLSEMSPEELERHAKILKLMGQRHRLLTDFMRRDAPGRFGVKYDGSQAHAAVALTITAEVPEQLKALVKDGFCPELSPEGEMEVKGVVDNNKTLSTVDGEAKEIGCSEEGT